MDRPRSTQERADWAGQQLGPFPDGRCLRRPPSRDRATGPADGQLWLQVWGTEVNPETRFLSSHAFVLIGPSWKSSVGAQGRGEPRVCCPRLWRGGSASLNLWLPACKPGIKRPVGVLGRVKRGKLLSPVQGWLKVAGGQPGECPPAPQGSPGGLQTDVPCRVPGSVPGAAPRPQAALLGFQKQLQAAPQKEGALGPPAWESATRRQHVAEDGASRPALLCHSLGQERLPIEPQFPGLQKGPTPSARVALSGKQPKALGYVVSCLNPRGLSQVL